jgi:hypothetical protein
MVQKAIDQLAMIKERKGMYFAPRVEEAETFLCGFRTALIVAGVAVSHESGRVALQRRGWQISSIGAIPSMRGKGWTDVQMIDELLESFADELRQIPENDYDATTNFQTPATNAECH